MMSSTRKLILDELTRKRAERWAVGSIFGMAHPGMETRSVGGRQRKFPPTKTIWLSAMKLGER